MICGGEYLNGKLNRRYKKYNDKGKLIEKGEYFVGEKDRIFKIYNNFGIVVLINEYSHGKLISKKKCIWLIIQWL